MPRSRKRGSIGSELATAHRSLRELEKSLARLAAQVRDLSRSKTAKPTKKRRRKLKLSPARLRALKLHGRYLGYIRQLKPKQRAEVKAVRDKEGVQAAIVRARNLTRARR